MCTRPRRNEPQLRGQKVAAIVITDDQSLQMSAEEALTRELSARGVVRRPIVTAARRDEERREGERLVRARRRAGRGRFAPRRHAPGTAAQCRRVDLRLLQLVLELHGYGWGTTYAVPLSYDKSTTISVETLVYDLTRDKLVWAATSETEDPKDLQRFVADLVKAAVDEMRKNRW